MEFTPESNTPGPQQVQNNFDANSEVSQQLGLLRTKGSTVSYGNLLTLPLTNVGGADKTDGGLLYVEPVYVQRSTGSASYPLLQKVLVAYGEKIGFQDTLDAALEEAFTGTVSPGTGSQNGGGSGGGGSSDNQALTQALDDATQALADAQSALAKGDFKAYGEAQNRLRDAIERAVAAQPSTSPPAPSGSSSPSKTATPAGSSAASPSG